MRPRSLSLTTLKWGVLAGVALLVLGFDLLRTQEHTDLGDLPSRLLLDLPIVVGAGIVVILVFHEIGKLHGALEARNAELLALHEATLGISGELDVDAVLQKVVERARQLSDGRYGALAVYREDGRIDRFLTSGITPDERRRMGAPPVGRGLLGAVLGGGETLRLRELQAHPRSAGFPPGHPPMRSLLAVPIVSSAPWRGNLYVADKRGAPEFDAEDEKTLQRFAAQAALAIDAAHLHRQVRGLAIAEERQRIAHEMHDGLAQVLASVMTGTQAVREHLRGGRTDEAVALLDQLRQAADTTYTETREGILALRAAGSAADQSIDAVLRDYVTEWQDRSGISASCVLDADIVVPSAVELQVVRIAQEALSNVRKHSQARKVEVRLTAGSDEYVLTIQDDGQGFDEGSGRTGGPRFGLATMRERAQAIGGALEIMSRRGEGSRVELRWQRSRREPEEHHVR
jgi:signal transduction histidine kinase